MSDPHPALSFLVTRERVDEVIASLNELGVSAARAAVEPGGLSGVPVAVVVDGRRAEQVRWLVAVHDPAAQEIPAPVR